MLLRTEEVQALFRNYDSNKKDQQRVKGCLQGSSTKYIRKIL